MCVMKKIKICYLVSSLCNEGPVNVMYNIIRYIDFSLFDVSIVTFIPEKENTRIEEFRRFPISIFQLGKEKKLSPWALFKSLKATVGTIDPDELHAHCPRSLYLMCFLPRRYKRIYTIHIYPGLQQLMLYGKMKGRVVIWLNNYFMRRCDLPIGCAESVGSQYKAEKGWDVVSIPNGSSLPVWKNDDNEKSRLRKEFGLKDGVKYFIFIGRFSKEKNPDVLVDTFNSVQRKDVGLIMLGQGPMWEDLNMRKGDNIIMPGFTTRVYDYLKAADYYISLSDVEGLANTILESMTVGLPMILSDIPSHREVLGNLSDEDIVGYIIDNHNIDDICRKIDMVMQLDAERVRRLIQNLYEKKYTAELMSMSYQKQYEQLINQ